MSIKRALNKEILDEISLNLDEKCSRDIDYSSQIVFFQSLHYTCFSSAVCPLQVPVCNLSWNLVARQVAGRLQRVICKRGHVTGCNLPANR